MPAKWDERLVLGLFRCVIKQQGSLKVDYEQLKHDMEQEYLPPGETVTIKALQLKWCDVRSKAKDKEKDAAKQASPRKPRAKKATPTGSGSDDEDGEDAQADAPTTTPKKRSKAASSGSSPTKKRSPTKSREMDDFLVEDDDD